MSSPPRGRMSPVSSPTRARKSTAPPGFLVPPKPYATPIARMTVRELRDKHARNAKILAEARASTSSYVERIIADQAAIESRLIELVGVEAIQSQLQQTSLSDSEPMVVDAGQPREYHGIDAKRRALAKFSSHSNNNRNMHGGGMSFQEAIQIEQEAHAHDLQRQKALEERRRRQGLLANGEVLTRKQQEARIWAFMNYKPTDSDLEDDDDDDEDDDDPSTWFDDDQDDGRKGQDIVEPDYEDLSNIIRIDESRIPYSLPRED